MSQSPFAFYCGGARLMAGDLSTPLPVSRPRDQGRRGQLGRHEVHDGAPRGPRRYVEPGRRVVEGQRLMQATSDSFLGYYWRQFKDMKGSADVEDLSVSGARRLRGALRLDVGKCRRSPG
jgi:hypothetical protein